MAPQGTDHRGTTSRDTRPALLTIGQFSRRSGLSYKALRLYDLSGLLPPAEVDPANGYRLYSRDQLERARQISLLRQLEMPLATVAEVLAGSDEEALHGLDRWWAEQEASMRTRRDSFEYLRTDLIRSGEARPAAYPVSLREVAETKVATIRREVDQQAVVPSMISSEEQVRQHLHDGGADATGEAWWIFHGLVTPDSEAPVEVCMPFRGMVDPAGPITIRIEPAHTEAYCTVTRQECCYPQIMLAYDAVASWARESGLPEIGSPREIYFARACETTADEPFAHVAQPVGRTSR